MLIIFKSFCNYFVEDITSTGATITMETVPLMHFTFLFVSFIYWSLEEVIGMFANKRYFFVCVYTTDVMKQFFPEV